jgi:hypothetical protein
MIIKVAQSNKILQSTCYFVNFMFYSPRTTINYVNTQTNSNIQSSQIQIEQIGLHPGLRTVILDSKSKAVGDDKEKRLG